MHLRFVPTPGDLEVLAIFQDEGVTINGQFYLWENAPDVVEYGEESGANVVCSGHDHTYSIEPSSWVNPIPPPEPDPEVVAQAALDAWRATATAKKWQLRMLLGPTQWALVEELGNDPSAILGYEVTQEQAWGLKVLIADIDDVPRLSETVEMLRFVLVMSDEAADDLFRRAAALKR